MNKDSKVTKDAAEVNSKVVSSILYMKPTCGLSKSVMNEARCRPQPISESFYISNLMKIVKIRNETTIVLS